MSESPETIGSSLLALSYGGSVSLHTRSLAISSVFQSEYMVVLDSLGGVGQRLHQLQD